MSHLKEKDGGPGHFSDEKIASLLKRDLINGFQLDENKAFSSVKAEKRPLKAKRTPEYRRIDRYFKSTRQYKKERNRRKKILHLWLVEFKSQKEIADKLGVSVSTVKRDQKKLRRYVTGQNNRAIRLMRDERHRAVEQAMEGLPLRERLDYLSLQIEKQKKFWRRRGYRGHYKIFHLDMTKADKYCIPKLTILPRQTANKTLAYPYKIRVVIKGAYEGKIFEADLGGFNIVQTTRSLW